VKVIVSTGIFGLAAAIASTGPYALAGVGAVALVAVVVASWVISDRARTRNAVALIVAVRSTGSRSKKGDTRRPED